MTLIRLDVRIDFPRLSHSPRRLDPKEKQARKAARREKWARENRARLAELARQYRARRAQKTK